MVTDLAGTPAAPSAAVAATSTTSAEPAEPPLPAPPLSQPWGPQSVRGYIADPGTPPVLGPRVPREPDGAGVAPRAYLTRAELARAASRENSARSIPVPRRSASPNSAPSAPAGPHTGPEQGPRTAIHVPEPDSVAATTEPARATNTDSPWLVVLDGAPGTEPGAVAAALPVSSAAHPGGLTVLPGRVGGATRPVLGTTTFGSRNFGAAPTASVGWPTGIDQPDLVGYRPGEREWDERSRCLAQAAVFRALPGRHLVARDWVSVLAAAAAVAHLDGGRLLRSRAGWAQTCVAGGLLRPADGYVLLDLEPRQSMARTASAPHGDPRRDVLVAEQFRAFWLSPAAAVRGFPVLAEVLRRIHIKLVDGRLAPSTLAQAVRDTLG